MLLISHFKWFLTRLYCSVSDDDSLLIDKLCFTEERFSSKMFHLRLLTNFLPPSPLKGQMPLNISKIFCRCSLTVLMEKDATLKNYLLVKIL